MKKVYAALLVVLLGAWFAMCAMVVAASPMEMITVPPMQAEVPPMQPKLEPEPMPDSAAASDPAAIQEAENELLSEADIKLLEEYNTRDYVGVWHQFYGVAAGYSDRFMFNEDGTFLFAGNEMDAASRELGYSGTWSFDDYYDALELTVTHKLLAEGGVPVPPDGSVASDYALAGAIHRMYSLPEEEYETRLYRVSTICLTKPYEDEGDLRRAVVIDGRQYWDFTDYGYVDDMFLYYTEQLTTAKTPAYYDNYFDADELFSSSVYGFMVEVQDFFFRDDDGRYEIIPWLKLRTEDGVEGWVRTGEF